MTGSSPIFSFIAGWGAELSILLVLMPLMSWLVEAAPVFCSGQRGFPLRLSYKRAFDFVEQSCKRGMDLKEGLCCAALALVFLSLPGFFIPHILLQKIPLNLLSDPLLTGTALLLVRFYLMGDNALPVTICGAFTLLWMYLLLLLMAPHHYGLFTLLKHANTSLDGVSMASLLALIISVPLPMASELRRVPWNEAEFRNYDRFGIDRKYGLLIFFQAIWLMFLSDLIVFPAKAGEWTGLSESFSESFFWRVFLVITGITVCRLTKMERNFHCVVLFWGLGLLFALSGRLGS